MAQNKVVKLVDNKDQYAECLAIREAVFVEEQGVPRSLEIDEFEDIATHFIAYFGSTPASTGRMHVKDDKVKFERIATISSLRGKGIARMLMLAMEHHSKSAYSDLLPYMHAQLTAATFYEGIGWKKIGAEFSEAGIRHVAMIKPHGP